MTGSHVARAARLLRQLRASVGPRPTPDSPVLVKAVADALARKARLRARRRVTTWTLGLVAGAASLALLMSRHHGARGPVAVEPVQIGVVTTQTPPSGAFVVDRSGRQSLTAGAVLSSGARVAAAQDRPIELALSTGTRLRLQGELDLLDLSATQRFALRTGRIDAHVAKLRGGERFVLEAGGVEVEVRGTTFQVALDASCPGSSAPHVSVRVQEGVVQVRYLGREALVQGGGTWRESCPEMLETAPLADAGPAAKMHAAETQVEHRASSRLVSSPVARDAGLTHLEGHTRFAAPVSAKTAAFAAPTPSILQADNDRFLAALDARRRGDGAAAVRGFMTLVNSGSPLGEAALVECLRTMRATNRSEARRLARHYLDRYRNGFARGEAEEIAAEEP